ncbi:hypothetical protein BH09VER1_BH09VER1_05330 [soil metagenome]
MTSRLAWSLVLCLAGCSHLPTRNQPAEPPLPPNTFQYHAGSFWTGGYSVKSVGKTVVLDQFFLKVSGGTPRRRTRTFHPNKDQWDLFWSELAVLEVFRWKRDYNSHLVDGFEWKFKASHNGHQISTQGECAYPSAVNIRRLSEDDGTRITMLQAAIERLIGHSLPEFN